MPSEVSTFPPQKIAPRKFGRSRSQPTAAPHVASERCRDILGDVMRQTVISRLRLAHPVDAAFSSEHRAVARPELIGPDLIGAGVVEDLVHVLRFEPQAEVDRSIEFLSRQHGGRDRLMLDLVPRAEMRLTELAAETSADAFDITLARCRLQDVVERHGAPVKPMPRRIRRDRRALLSTGEPGAFHIRLRIAADCLSRDGWDVCCESDSKLSKLVDLVRYDWFALVVVASEHASVDLLGSAIRALRRASANQDLRVLLLSAPLVESPERLVRVGADAAAADIRQATLQADRLLTLMPPRPWAPEACI